MPRKIAIIDDSAAFVLLVKQLLEIGPDYEVEAYRSADEFFKAGGRASEADLIILDLNMPGTYGLQALEEMRRNPNLARIPILLLSGDARYGNVVAGHELGANSFMSKPIDPALFIERVRSLLGQ